jgi:hypothetical protein
MGSEVKSRGKISGEIENRKRETDKRLDTMQKDVKDKKTIQEVAKGIKLNVTTEGMKAIKDGVQRSAKETGRSFEKKNQALKKEVFVKDKAAEKELKTQGDQTRADMARMKQAAGRIDGKGAKQGIEEASKGAGQDAKFFSKQHERQASDRKHGESEEKKKERELKGTKISYSK